MVCVEIIGYTAIIYAACRAGSIVWRLTYPFYFGKRRDLKKLAGANWAVITGATDGIGRSFAFEFAKQGFDLILISRTQQRLDNTALEIRRDYENIDVKTIQFDFTEADEIVYERNLLSKLEGYEIGVLVNNVGMARDYPCALHETAGGLEKIRNIAVINTLPMIILCSYVLKQMKERRGGLIVNISSISATTTMPFFNVYSASKQYMSWLSEILRKEYSQFGITIQTLTPSFVETKLAKNLTEGKRSSSIPSPDEYVKSAVGTIGLARETTGYIYHQLMSELVIKMMPSFMLNWQMGRYSEAAKKKALESKDQ